METAKKLEPQSIFVNPNYKEFNSNNINKKCNQHKKVVLLNLDLSYTTEPYETIQHELNEKYFY